MGTSNYYYLLKATTMNKKEKTGKKDQDKGWFGRLLEKWDKQLEEKSKQQGCCKSKNPSKGSSCC